MNIVKRILANVEGDFTLSDAYTYAGDVKMHSVRARIYEGIEKGLFKRISRGVYTVVDHNGNSTLIVNGDGRDLSMIADNSIDAIITDHPYFDPKSNTGGSRKFAEYSCFNYEQKDFDEKFRVLKDGCFLVEFFAEENSNNFDYIYECKKMAQKSGFEYYSTVNWKKGNFVSNTGRKAKNTEQMVFFTKGKPRSLKVDKKKLFKLLKDNNIGFKKNMSEEDLLDLVLSNNLTVPKMSGTRKMLPVEFDFDKTIKSETIHQAEKPIALIESLLDYITLKDELVLDQFGGSLNTAIACLNKGRNSILFEKDEETYNLSVSKKFS